jgi:histone H3/H4
MDKKEMINWLYALCGACEDMELVRANFKDYRKPLHMTAHKLIHEVVGALESAITKQDALNAIQAKMDTVEKPDVVLGMAAAMSAIKLMDDTPQEIE